MALFGIPQFRGPPGPWNGSRLMVFAQKVLAPGPGTSRMKGRFGAHLHEPYRLRLPLSMIEAMILHPVKCNDGLAN